MDINNISPYIPTQYVDYSTPDINAVNLNKAEVALQRVTAAANEAINAIKELNAAKIDTAKIVTSLASTDTLSVLSGAIGPVIDQRLTDLLNKYNQLNGERFTHETISAKILANANHVDIIVSKSLKKLITVMSTSGDGVYIRQASAINAKSVRVYTNSDSSERNTAFLVLYL